MATESTFENVIFYPIGMKIDVRTVFGVINTKRMLLFPNF